MPVLSGFSPTAFLVWTRDHLNVVALDQLGDGLYEHRKVSGIRTGQSGVLTSHVPVGSVSRLLVGIVARSFKEDFYERIHIRPNHIDLGSSMSAQTREIEVWNAWFNSNPLQAIESTKSDGMTLTGPEPIPTGFGALESRVYELSITPNGPPIIDASFLFEFVFGSAALRAIGRRIVGWVFSPDWSQPVIERLEWLTQVMESHSGREQRVRLRTGARRTLEYSQLLGSHRERVRLENLLHAWQARVFGLPLWQEVQITNQAINAGATSILVNTYSLDFEVGALVGLVKGSDSEFAEITDIQAGLLSLKSPLEKSWPAGSKLLPVKPARLQNDLKLKYHSDAIVQTRSRFQLEEEWLVTPIAEPLQYRGFPVLMTASNWAEDLDAEHSRKLVELDYLTGRRALDDLSGTGSVRRVHHWLLNGRDAIAEFRAWLAARAGKLKPFWLPSFQADLELTSPIGAFDSAITVDNRSFAANGGAGIGRQDIVIATTNGQHYLRRVTGVTALTDTTESVAIDSVLGVAILQTQIRYIAFMKLVRLDTDAVEIAHHTDQLAEVSLTLRSLKDDT